MKLKSFINKYSILTILIGFSSANLCSQDFIFSQYFSSQTYLNPALTGFFDGSYRLSGNYRTQSLSDGVVANTFGASADLGLFKKSESRDYVGIGVSGYRENLKLLTNNIGRLSVAYHKSLSYDGTMYLTMGSYAGLNHEGLNKNLIAPEDQNDIQRFSTSNFDVGLGLNFYQQPNDLFSYFIGFSADHLIPQKNSFLNTNQTKPMRFNGYGSLKFLALDNLYIVPGFLYSRQASQQQINAGAMAQFLFGNYLLDKSSFSVGPYIRFGNQSFEALIAMARLEYKGMSFGLSYDFNLNDLRYAPGTSGALELSVGFIGLIEREYKSRADCPNTKNF